MLSWLRKNQKKILAFFVVFLMIAFLADFRTGQGQGPDLDATIGKVGDQPLTQADYEDARRQLSVLTAGGRGFGPLHWTLHEKILGAVQSSLGFLGTQFVERMAIQQTFQIAEGIDDLHYALLLREARRMNVHVPSDRVEDVLRTMEQNGLLAGYPQYNRDAMTYSLSNWLTILNAFDRVASIPKVSAPAATHAIAASQQRITLNLVEFPAQRFRDSVAAPTAEQLQQHFTAYKDRNPQDSETGIGYRYPNRVKLSYVMVPIEKIKPTVTDEEIYEYYAANQKDFPASQPATLPATTAATAPAATQQASTTPSTQPAYRDWREPQVKDEIRAKLASERAEKLTKQIEQTMRNDFAAYRNALRQGAATTGPSGASSLGVPYASQEYLDRLQIKIQKSRDARGVLPETTTFATQFMDREFLAALKGIGDATVADTAVPFPTYVFQAAEPLFLNPPAQPGDRELALLQPSAILRDAANNRYIFRITEVDPAHAPASLAEVETKAREDWIRLQAYEKAKAAAEKFLAEAKSKGLQGAANAAGNLPLVNSGSFSVSAQPENPKITDEKARAAFIEGGFSLLHERLRTNQQHPVGLIDLPRIATVYVAQLDDAQPATRTPIFELMVYDTQRRLEARQADSLIATWFSPTAIESRLDYKQDGADSSSRREAPAPRRPRNPLGI
jgi:hypothetical protein